ncbi:hypothetical protein VM1G_05844 [Cytospora mali]|uniref:Uncharacterized protein n=1 Tax=Cytospora mali TaxID=578113 RepID=A0A194W350_CYTMA|nr:hypothetical protein VM1G_05844 [Valsa mali]
MQALIDMASSPQYLAPSAHNQVGASTASLPEGSCPNGQQPTVAYQDPNQDSYSTVSHFSPPTIVDDNLLTPVSSAASPPLQHRQSKIQSPYHQQQDSSCSQQPTPPNTSTMYPYPDYLGGTTQASSPMAVQTAVTQAPHDMLYLHHSPGHEDPLPPPQANPYFGHYSASSVSVGQEQDGISSYSNYLNNAMHDNSYGMMERPSLPDIGNSYTHRPLAPSTHTHMATILQQPQPGPYRRDLMPISRLSPTNFTRAPPVVVKRHPTRKPRVRGKVVKREQSSSPPLSQGFGLDGSGRADPDTPAEEVTLDEKTPDDLKRLWDIRRKWQKKKGHGMWEDIVREFTGPEADNLSDDKKTQLKANLQMRVHRGVMKYGSWPESDKAALLRAYKRWEEMRYIEIHRLFLEEVSLQGRQNPSFEWRTNHIEAELVKEGLEDKQREAPSKARRRRVQVPARHVLRGGSTSGPSSRGPAPPQQRLPPVFNLGSQPQPLTEEQQDRLIEECLERTPFEPTPDPEPEDAKMSDYPEEHLPRSRPQSSSLPTINGMMTGSSDVNAQRSAAVARQACGEMMKQQQQTGHQYAGV